MNTSTPVKAAQNEANHDALDPNIMQRAAADPLASVWVNASAGTGKTKVLTDRLIRLMLPRAATQAYPAQDGTPPHRILCLTYTKAGAGEMLNRIMETLSKWAAMEDPALRQELEDNVLGHPPTDEQMHKARALFAEVVDTPGGIKIMTIHSFCQSLLGRFPVEAQLPPDFALMSEDETRSLIRKARDHSLHDALHSDDARRQKLMAMLTKAQNSEQLISLLNHLIGQRQKISRAIEAYQGLPHLLRAVYELHDLPAFADDEELAREAAEKMPRSDLEALISWLQSSTGTRDQEKARRLTQALAVQNDIVGQMNQLAAALLYYKDTSPTNKLKNDRPDLLEIYLTLCDHAQNWQQTRRALQTCLKTEIVLQLAETVITRYSAEKHALHKLDYDDLILRSVALVQSAPQWVMYKLDGGIDHILVDEAQDSNPEQWVIIDALVQEFFAGQGRAEETIRTLFVVGDEKQSIFGFQGADPDVFQYYRQSFARHFDAAGLDWRDQPLNISFRSVQAVLDIVDHSFAAQDKTRALTGKADAAKIEHKAFRGGQAGHVELWPLIKPDEAAAQEPWARPDPERNPQATQPRAMLAQKIAATIRGWLDSGERLDATQHAIRPGDIMVLVRNRNSFVDHMIRALKDAHIPVSGVDRMVLSQQIAVQDLLALARFALLPDDDLSLACVLKSPLVGLDEDALFTLAHNRQGRLWPALKNAAKNTPQNPYRSIKDWLEQLIRKVKQQGVHEFFSRLLIAPCPAHTQSALRGFIARLGEDALDPLEEFLSRAFDFDLKHRSDVQHFLHVFENNEESIKRELDEGQNVVRIMTVHGSKGLQAPIVFLPDTILTAQDNNKADKFLWHDAADAQDQDGALPLWVNTADEASAHYEAAKQEAVKRREEEYERLLYVALTRAEDRLYIGGCLPSASTKSLPHSWYYTAQNALANHPHVIKENQAADSQETQDDMADDSAADETLTLIYKTQQNKNAKTQKVKPLLSVDLIDKGARDAILPPAFMKPPRSEPDNPPRPLQPSRPSEDEETPALSPLKASDSQNRFKRGNLIHALLQFLPDLPANQRRAKAAAFITRHAPDTDEAAQSALLDEVFAIIEHPDYAPLFGPHSKAEAPITGTTTDAAGQTHVVSGQIDRLLIDHDAGQVMVVDYKTNRPAPRDAKDIPLLYRRQMQAYRDLLAQIYEGYTIKTYLLWTDYTAIMDVPPLH